MRGPLRSRPSNPERFHLKRSVHPVHYVYAFHSIASPDYNGEDGIAQVIERVLGNTEAVFAAVGPIEELEVIVVDDASGDRTREIAASYQEVIVISQKIILR